MRRLSVTTGFAVDVVWESGKADEANQFLGQIPPAFRGWEWSYRKRRFKSPSRPTLVKVTITNSGAALAGPIYLEVTPPAGMQVFNKAGFTQGFAMRPSSAKQPYLLVSSTGLATGSTASITVDIVSLAATKPVLGLKVLYGGLP